MKNKHCSDCNHRQARCVCAGRWKSWDAFLKDCLKTLRVPYVGTTLDRQLLYAKNNPELYELAEHNKHRASPPVEKAPPLVEMFNDPLKLAEFMGWNLGNEKTTEETKLDIASRIYSDYRTDNHREFAKSSYSPWYWRRTWYAFKQNCIRELKARKRG